MGWSGMGGKEWGGGRGAEIRRVGVKGRKNGGYCREDSGREEVI